jgi:hypothetical protein
MNFYFNDYLTKCDLIYKYNLENIKLIPKIKKINISLKIDSDSKNLDNSTSSSNFLNIHLFLIIYISYFCFPFIKYFKNDSFSLNLNILKKNQIFFFLDSLFLDNFYKLKYLNLLSLSSLSGNSLLLKTNNNFRLKLPLNVFEEINEFLQFNNLNSKEFYIVLTFSLENCTFSNLKSSSCFLKNLPYFWVFN